MVLTIQIVLPALQAVKMGNMPIAQLHLVSLVIQHVLLVKLLQHVYLAVHRTLIGMELYVKYLAI